MSPWKSHNRARIMVRIDGDGGTFHRVHSDNKEKDGDSPLWAGRGQAGTMAALEGVRSGLMSPARIAPKRRPAVGKSFPVFTNREDIQKNSELIHLIAVE